ncbi:MAG TPA: hypothetical protein PLK31_07740 [Chloroflexota bacterium]|nr:hypothetical protein [Chloroflexota bacterium]
MRDIAAWTVQATEKRLTGPYNVTGPNEHVTMRQVLHTCKEISGSDATFTWVSDEFLEANEVAAYTKMPLWVPAAFAGYDTVNCQKAIETGLMTRPLPDTIRDTLEWAHGRAADYQWRNGMKPEREAGLLTLWRNQEAVSGKQ